MQIKVKEEPGVNRETVENVGGADEVGKRREPQSEGQPVTGTDLFLPAPLLSPSPPTHPHPRGWEELDGHLGLVFSLLQVSWCLFKGREYASPDQVCPHPRGPQGSHLDKV